MLNVRQQEGKAPLVIGCVLLSLDEGLVSQSFCLLESPFLFCSRLVHLSFFLCRFTGSMRPVFPAPLDLIDVLPSHNLFLSKRTANTSFIYFCKPRCARSELMVVCCSRSTIMALAR